MNVINLDSLNDDLINGYFNRLIGEDGISLIRNMPNQEVTDEEIYEILNPLIAKKKKLESENVSLKSKCKEETNEKNVEVIKKEIKENEINILKLKEKIKKNHEITLNSVRKILFILYENKFTICKRERDTNSGWLTFRWKLNLCGIEHQLEREKKKLYRNLLKRKEYEENNIFYVCPNHCLRLIFDEATEADFLCPICNSNLMYEDNKPFVDLLNKRIEDFKY